MMQTEKLVARVFDYQKLAANARLQAVIDRTHDELFKRELSDDEVQIWAAGEPQQPHNDPLERKHHDD